MEILTRVISKKERLFELGEEVVRGWQIELAPVEPNPAEQELVFGGTLFTTIYGETADRFTVGEIVPFTLNLGTPPVKIAIAGRAN